MTPSPLAATALLALFAGAGAFAPSPSPVEAPAFSESGTLSGGDRSSGELSGPADAPAADTVSTLEVSGSAEIDVATDVAHVTFAVETEDSTARRASQRNAERMEAVLSALRGLDGELEIETSGYRLQPRYRRPGDGGTREIDGFRAANSVQVTSTDVRAVGALVDVAVEAGANRVESVRFEASELEETRREALRRAVTRARGQAEAIAEAMGVSLGEALEVRTGSDTPRPLIQYRAEAAALQDASTPVEPGEQTVSANVTIRYRLVSP